MASLTSLPPWTERVRIVPPAYTEGVWHVVGLKFNGSRLDSQFCLGWNDPARPPTAEYLAERFADRRWYVCGCRRCKGQVVLVYAADGLAAVQTRDGLRLARRKVT